MAIIIIIIQQKEGTKKLLGANNNHISFDLVKITNSSLSVIFVE